MRETIDNQDRSAVIREGIAQRGMTVKSFAAQIGMPYSTLLSILKSGVGGAALDNLQKICAGLQLPLAALQSPTLPQPPTSGPALTTAAQRLLKQCRALPEMQPAVCKLLDIEKP